MHAQIPPSVTALIPLALIGLVVWAISKWGRAQLWELIVTLLLGVVLSGTILGPDISHLLSQFSGGHLH